MEEIQITVEYLEPGPRGEKGWTALYNDESYIVNGKQRIIKKLTDYVGGQGTKPNLGLGLFLTENGLFTSDKNLALNYKGIQGEKPGHVWTGTSLAIENTDGTMGNSVDLKGASAYKLWLDAGNVGTMADFLYSLKKESVDAAVLANNAATNANEKAIAAQTAATNANQATQAANTATGNANSATTNANDKATLADAKATLADQKATLANTAATNADSKAAAAQTATTNANTATGAANTAATAANNAAGIANAAKGWTPVYALVDDGIRTVQKLVDYVGGTGAKPTANINSYVTTTGFSTVIADGKDIRGTAGLAGVSRIPVWTASVYANNASVLYLGKYWTSNAATLAADVPGTSAKWVEDLTAYNPRNKQVLDFITNRLIVASDNNSFLRGNSETDLNLIIPANANVALPIGFQVLVKQQGAGRIIVVTEQGVTLQSPDSKVSTSIKYSQIWLVKEDTNVWSLEGSLTKNVFDTFYSKLLSEGAVYDKDLFMAELNNIPALSRNSASMILASGAYKSGFVYGFLPDTGNLVPFVYSRAGAATYIDKDGLLKTAIANVPRIDFDPATKVCKGYMIEDAATNLVKGLSTEDWQAGGSRTLKTNNNEISPDGTRTGVKLEVARIEAGGYFLNGNVPIGNLSSRTFTFSFWAKSDSAKNCTIFMYGLTGTEDVKNSPAVLTTEWKRFFFTTTFKASMISTTLIARLDLPNAAIVGDFYHIWGAQVEEKPNATSYIYTSTAQVSRSADSMVAINQDLFGKQEGTVVTKGIGSPSVGLPGVFTVSEMSNGTITNRVANRMTISTGSPTVLVVANDIVSLSQSLGEPMTSITAVAYKQNDFILSSNGRLSTAGNIGEVPPLDRISVGLGLNTSRLNGTVRYVSYSPKRLTNAELQTLTT